MDNNSQTKVPSVRPYQFEDGANDIFKDSVNLFRGDVNLSLELVSLKGRNGLDVKVTAAYGSNVKDQVQVSNAVAPTGILGLGWNLSFQRIEVEPQGNASSNDNRYFIIVNDSSTEMVRVTKEWLRGSIDDSHIDTLNQNKIDKFLIKAFAKNGLAFSHRTAVVTLEKNKAWKVTDKQAQRIYNIENRGSELAITAGGAAFECFQFEFSQIRYYQEFERWEIINDDGMINSFGGLPADTEEDANTIQWKIKWGNWIGESNQVQSSGGIDLQSRYPVAWNLASTETVFGDKIYFSYHTVEQQVGEGGLSFTKACYLSEIIDMFQRRVIFNYEEKEYQTGTTYGAREYMAPNWNAPYTDRPDNSPSPYQDRYQTRYLKSIEVQNEDLDTLYTVFLDYYPIIASNFSTYSRDNYLYGDTVKRTLKGIRRVFADGCSKPGLLFDYVPSGSVNAGAMSAAITPEGAKVAYRYKQQELSLCNRDLEIANPWPGSAQPRVWFGADYVLTTWLNESTNEIKITLYTWVGHWQEWIPGENIIKTPFSIDTVNAVVTENFLCFSYSAIESQKSYVHIYHKNNGKSGQWYDTDKITINSSLLALAAGDNFFLACDRENRTLVRYTWDCFAKVWNISDETSVLEKGNPNATPYLAAANKYYAILDYNPEDGGEHQNSLNLFYQDSAYQWQEGASQSLIFTIGGEEPSDSFGFTASASFIALTYINTEYSLSFDYTVRILGWDENYANITVNDFAYTLPKSNPSKQITIQFLAQIVDNSMVVSGPFLLRYNGGQWLENNLDVPDSCTDQDINWFAYGKDFAIYTRNRESSCKSELLDFDPNNSVTSWDNTPSVLFEKDDPSINRKTLYFPTAGTNIATMGNRVYRRGTHCNWEKSVSDYQLLPDDINTTTVINQGPSFLTYLNQPGDTPDSTTVLPLINQLFGEDETIYQRYFTQLDETGTAELHTNGQYPAGLSSFVTSLPMNKDFDEADSITLHRYIEHAIEGKLIDYCVGSMTINDGYQNNTTKYEFDINYASCDPSGKVVKYFTTRYYPGTDSVESPEFGKVENVYYNGFSINRDDEQDSICAAMTADFGEAPVLMDGQLIRRQVFDAAGKMITEEKIILKSFTFVEIDDVTYNLSGGYFRVIRNDQQQDGLVKTTNYKYEPSYGKLSEEYFDNVGNNGQIITIGKEYHYAFEEYPWFVQNNVLNAPLAEYNFVRPASQNNNEILTGASLQTYSASDFIISDAESLERVVWCTDKSYVLKEVPEDFQCNCKKILENSEPGSEWLLVNTVLSRTVHGIICSQQDITQKVETSFFDKKEMMVVAKFSNEGIGECLYTGFEDYEDYDSGWQMVNSAFLVSDFIVDGDAQIGTKSLTLAAGATLAQTTSVNQSQRCILSSWIKAESGFTSDTGALYWEIIYSTGTVEAVEVKPGAEGKWVYWQTVVSFDSDEAVALSLKLVNNKSSKYLLLNNVCFSPLTGEMEINVYDPVYSDLMAKMGKNADIARYVYDPLRREIAEAGPAENSKSGNISYATREFHTEDNFVFPANDPNSVCSIAASKGGIYETFTRGEQIWEIWNRDDASRWQVQDRMLKHSGSSVNAIQWLPTAELGRYAVGFSVLIPEPQNTAFGISIGEILNVKWSYGTGWEMSVNGEITSDTSDNTKVPVNVLFIPMNGAILLLVDGRRVFAEIKDVTISGEFTLSSQGDMSFSNFITYCGPQVSISYNDGKGKPVQEQVQNDTQCLVKQNVYNNLSLNIIETKIVRFDNTFFKFRPGFITSIDWETGVMTGEVSDYYPDDNGYPYTRTEYEKSSLERPVKKGLPGNQFAITADNTHILRFEYGVEDMESVAGIRFVEGDFLVNLVTDPNGSMIYEIKDRMGRTLGKQVNSQPADDSTIEAVQQVYDEYGNIKQILPPNYFTVTGGNPGCCTYNSYNFLKQLISVENSDSGVSKFIYDPIGQLRFYTNAKCTKEGKIMYKKYDIMGRIAEEGNFTGDWGDGTVWQSIADTDPNYPENNAWDKLNIYDGTGEDVTLRGRLWKSYCQAGSGRVIENIYGYDNYGSTILSMLNIPGLAAYTTCYGYDNLGNVIEVNYPENALVPKIVYTYNSMGQNTGIGIPHEPEKFAKYTYNADGSIAGEVLNSRGAKPLQRSVDYNSPGWIKKICNEYADKTGIFEQTFDYTSEGYDDAGYYNGSIAKVSNRNMIDPARSFDYRFKYDMQDQLLVAQHSGNPGLSIGINSPTAFDPNGNIETIQVGEAVNSCQYQADTNKIVSISTNGTVCQTYGYNEIGSVIASSYRNIINISYNNVSNLPLEIGLNDAKTISFNYNSSGQRVIKIKEDESQKVYVHGLNDMPLLEIEQGTVQYIYGVGGLLAMIKSGVVYFILKDHQGSVRVVVSEDGTIGAMLDYMPYGGLFPDVYGDTGLCCYTYTGQEFDADLGLYNYRARLYDAQLGRFYSVDPKLQYGSPFIYCGNNPFNLTDPTGEELVTFLIILAIGAAIGAAAGAATAAYSGYKAGLKGGKLAGYIFAGAGIGAVCGALSAASGVGAFAVGSVAAGAATTTAGGIAAGFAAGAGVGAVAGAAIGAAQGVSQHFINDAFGVQNSGSWQQSLLKGAITGAVSGAIAGGIAGAGGAVAVQQSLRYARITGNNGWAFSPRSLSQVSEAYSSFSKLGVIPLPSFVSKIPNINVPVIGGLQTFVLSKFSLPILSSGVGTLASLATGSLFSSSVSSVHNEKTSEPVSAFYGQNAYNPSMNGSIGMQIVLLTNPASWNNNE